MRRTILVLSLCGGLALLFASSARAGDGWSLEDYLNARAQAKWSGCGVGSMIHIRQTQTITMPQLPAPRKTVTETKETLLAVTDDGYKVKVETLNGGQWTTSEKVEPKVAMEQSKVEDAGTGTVSVGGTDYPCTKKTVTMTMANQPGQTQTWTIWENADKGILEVDQKGAQDSSLKTEEFDAPVTVGDQSVSARKFALSMQIHGHATTGTFWASTAVPGRFVRQEISGDQGPVKFEMKREVVEFLKK